VAVHRIAQTSGAATGTEVDAMTSNHRAKIVPMLPSVLVPNRRSIVTGIAALGLPGIPGRAFAADALDSGQFRIEVMALLKQKRPKWQISAARDVTEIMIGSQRAYLGNLYKTLGGRTGKAREDRILDFFDASLAVGKDDPAEKDFGAAKPRLRARIIHRDYETQIKGTGVVMLARPLSDATRIAYVIDSDKTVQYVMAKHATAWPADAETIHAAAIANLDAISTNTEIRAQRSSSGSGRYAAINVRDSYAAARVLAPNFMRRLRDALGPTIFVGVPNRDFLIAWTPDFEQRRGFAAQVAKDAVTEAYALTDELFVSSADSLRVATRQELADHGR
jgi:uncharacterized protein YtpQ (UPF0354 family)